MQLTADGIGAIKRIGVGAQKHDPPLVLKLVGSKKVENQANKTVRYRVILSDGSQNVQGLVVPKFHDLFEQNKIPNDSILQISQIGVSQKDSIPFIILHEFSVVDPNAPPTTAAPPVASIPQPTSSNNTFATSGNQQFQQLHNQPPPPQPNFQSDPNAPITVPIASINPYQSNWTILGRVSQKSDIKKYNNAKGEGKLFNFNVIDQSGEIRATCFNDQVDQFFDMIHLNKVYYISQAKVNSARKEFSGLDHSYELMLNSNASIIPSNSEISNIPKISYHFKKLSEIDHIEQGQFIDVIAVVKQTFEKSSVMTKNSQQAVSKRDLILVDESKRSIRLTLWGTNADNLNIEGQPIIACKGVRVSEFQGKNLSASSTSTIELNPEIEESYALRGWFDAQGNKENFDSYSQITPSNNSRSKLDEIADIKDKQLEQNDKPLFFSVCAAILHIRNTTMYYPACASDNCNKKVIARDDQWFCESCNRSFAHPKYRYTLSANIADHTGQLWVSIFDASANELLQKSADQVQNISESDHEQVKEILAQASFKQHIFRCTARNEIYNDQSRMKYTVISVSPIDYAQQSELCLAAISQFD